MSTANTLVWITALIDFVLFVALIYFTLKFAAGRKKQVYALFVSADRRPLESVRIDGRAETFTHQKGRYNVGEAYLRFKKKYFLVYQYGKADPIDVISKEHSRMPAEVYEAIIQAEIIKALNKPVFGLFGLTWKRILMFAGAALVLYVIFNQFSGGAV